MSAPGRFWTVETRALLAMALLIGILAILKPGGERESEGGELRPSTFLSGKWGARALYLAAQELRIKCDRWMLPFSEAGRGGAASPRSIAVLGPTERVLPSEAEWLRAFVEGGGRLLYAASGAPEDAFLDALGLTLLRGKRVRMGSLPASPLAGAAHKDPSGRLGDPPLADSLRLLEGTAEAVSGFPQRIALATPRANRTEVLLSVAGGSGVAAAVVRIGAGRAVVLSHALPISNDRLRDCGVAPLVLRALADLSAGDTIWFDEFHHGFDERASLWNAAWRFLKGTNAGFAILQLGLVALLALFFAGIRIGSPLPPPLPAKRSSLEHVEALAQAYRAARAKRRAAALLLEGLRLRLGGRLPAELASAAQAPDGAVDLVKLSRSIDRVLAESKEEARG